MEILFQTSQLRKVFNSNKLLVRHYGALRARLIQRRLGELRAANILEDLRSLPQARCHELTGDRAGQISVDVGHPYRLLFGCANDPAPRKPDGGLDWKHVTAIRILEVEDTHG
jgi:proteic killer suppression protein